MATLPPLQLCAFGCHIRATASTQDCHEILQRYIFPSIPRLDASSAAADLRIQLEKADDQFRLLLNENEVSVATEPSQLIPDLIHAIDEAIVSTLSTLRAVHAGAVQLGDRVLLLPGFSHAGKSSMVAELLRRGATYFSDEYALIDADGRVHAYPRPMLQRNGGSHQVPVLAEESGVPVASSAAQVGWIMEMRYRPGSVWNLTPVAQSAGLLILLRHTPHLVAECPDLIDKFQRAASGAQCFVGHRIEAKDAVDEILRLTSA